MVVLTLTSPTKLSKDVEAADNNSRLTKGTSISTAIKLNERHGVMLKNSTKFGDLEKL